jgi:hypothetical protein
MNDPATCQHEWAWNEILGDVCWLCLTPKGVNAESSYFQMSYRIESKYKGEWVKVTSASAQWCRGWLARSRNASPCPAFRLVRESDGKVFDEHAERTEVSIGQVAGWPTAEQYEAAAERALVEARRIREADRREAKAWVEIAS